MKIWKGRIKRRRPRIDETRFVEATKIHTAISRIVSDIGNDVSDGCVVHCVEFDGNKNMAEFVRDNPDLKGVCIT